VPSIHRPLTLVSRDRRPRCSAIGWRVTVLALRPAEGGLFAATSIDGPRLPLFTIDRIVVKKKSTCMSSAPGLDA